MPGIVQTINRIAPFAFQAHETFPLDSDSYSRAQGLRLCVAATLRGTHLRYPPASPAATAAASRCTCRQDHPSTSRDQTSCIQMMHLAPPLLKREQGGRHAHVFTMGPGLIPSCFITSLPLKNGLIVHASCKPTSSKWLATDDHPHRNSPIRQGPSKQAGRMPGDSHAAYRAAASRCVGVRGMPNSISGPPR